MSPELALQRTYELAQMGYGSVSPNPPVGCVILDQDHNFISEGYHKKFGGPHAEIEALNLVKDQSRLKGAHVFVSLEPCAHEGKTGSCAKKLSGLPIASVTIGCKDPNPLVSGAGIKIIEQAGIKVSVHEDQEKVFFNLIEIFRHNMQHKTCFVALKVATSLDGQMALKNGESQWITGEESRNYSHVLRARYDAVLVGRKTIQADDPSLNIRLDGEARGNKLVILDPQGQIISDLKKYKFFKVREPKDIIFVVNEDCMVTTVDCEMIKLKAGPQGFDLKQLRRELYKKGVYSIFCEGGAETHSSFLSQREFNKVYNFIAPQIIGAENGLSWTKVLSVSNLKQAVRLEFSEVRPVGADRLVISHLKT